MKKLLLSIVLLSSALPQSRDANITLYKDGFGLVKQPIVFHLDRGRNTVTYSALPDKMESQSPFLSMTGAELLYQRYNHDVFNAHEFLKDHLGEKVRVKPVSGMSYKGRLLDVDGKWITVKRWRSVRIFNLNEVMNIKVGKGGAALAVRPQLSWEVMSPTRGEVPGKLIYISEGFDWDADYRLVISPDEQSGILASQAVLKNGTNLSFSHASVELVEGDLRRLYGREAPGTIRRGKQGERLAAGEERAAGGAVTFEMESVGDYYFYSLSGALSVPRKESITVALYPERAINFSRLYLFENRERTSREEPLLVQLSFSNTEENGLGMPLPGGPLQIYYTAADGGVKFAGEDFLHQVTVDEEASVIAGRAFDVLGRRTVVNYDRKKKSEEATILVEIKNKRQDTISARLIEHIYGDWVIRDPSHNYKRVDAQTIQFDLGLKPESTETVIYTYRKEWQ
ncbi:MAG: DUF4139 domain-containing protein [Fidelibacterota bacterium]